MKYFLTLVLKTFNEVISLNSRGRLFQSLGPATTKTLNEIDGLRAMIYYLILKTLVLGE